MALAQERVGRLLLLVQELAVRLVLVLGQAEWWVLALALVVLGA